MLYYFFPEGLSLQGCGNLQILANCIHVVTGNAWGGHVLLGQAGRSVCLCQNDLLGRGFEVVVLTRGGKGHLG